MEKVFLIGDSIRTGAHGEKGYGDILKEMLYGRAEVYQPDDNCKFTVYTFRFLHEWLEQVPNADEINYVLWNNGLWDTLIFGGFEEPLVPLSEYLNYVDRIYHRIRYLLPNAKIVFINTTNVTKELGPNNSRRFNSQIQEYNAKAQDLLSKYTVPVIDFYSISEKIPLALRSDWVHFKTEGSKILADILFNYLAERLPPKMNEIDYGLKAAETILEQFTPQQLEPRRFFAYFQGVFLSGLEKLYQKTGNRVYYNYIKEWVDYNTNEDGTIFETGTWARLTSLDFRKAGTLLFRIYQETEDIKYWHIIEYLVESLKYYPKNKYGGFWHACYHEEQMWLDGLYMAGPICTMYAKATGNTYYLDLAIKQMEIMWDHMQDPKTGLMFHGWDDNRRDKKAPWADPDTGLSSEIWGRALGWYAVAICDMLEYIPADHQKTRKIRLILSTILKKIIEYQDQIDGRWYEVVDKGNLPDNWHENSCSCLFVNAIARAVMNQCLGKEYASAAQKGFNGIIMSLKHDEHGKILLPDVCAGTPIDSGTYEYYVNRPRRTNDLHGIGTFILMCNYMEDLKNYLNEKN